MIRYKLHHLGMLCADLDANVRFYTNVLQHQEMAQPFAHEQASTYIGSGSDLLLEVKGAPFSPLQQAHIDRYGYGFHHLALSVDGALDDAYAELRGKGVQIAWEPKVVPGGRSFALYDDCGVLVEVLQESMAWARPQRDASVNFLLHHFDIFSDNWKRTKAFYETHFGFRSIFEYVYDRGGAFIYLADSYFDAENRQAMIEVIGPPYEEDREFVFSEKYGTGMDHIGYFVPNVNEAYEQIIAQGVGEFIRPYVDYGTAMCWVQDGNGEDLELMLALPAGELEEAFDGERPYRPNL